jgi:hypothetical protein
MIKQKLYRTILITSTFKNLNLISLSKNLQKHAATWIKKLIKIKRFLLIILFYFMIFYSNIKLYFIDASSYPSIHLCSLIFLKNQIYILMGEI